MTPSGESVSPQPPKFGTTMGETADCPVCARAVKLTAEGEMWRHWVGDDPPCPGSDRRPADVA